MACQLPLPTLSPIPFENVQFRDGMGLRLCNSISHCEVSNGKMKLGAYSSTAQAGQSNSHSWPAL